MDGIRKHKVIRAIIALSALLGIVVAAYITMCRSRYQMGEKRREVIDCLANGQLSIGQTGVVSLPPHLSSTSTDGQIYACLPKSDLLLVAFSTWRGKGYNMEGVLYCSRPLSPTEVQRDYYGNTVILVGPVDLVLEKQIDLNWYEVSYRLD